jgi:hypothetical protein
MPTEQAPRPLPDGLRCVLRSRATSGQIGDLLALAGEPADRTDHRLVVEDPDAG